MLYPAPLPPNVEDQLAVLKHFNFGNLLTGHRDSYSKLTKTTTTLFAYKLSHMKLPQTPSQQRL